MKQLALGLALCAAVALPLHAQRLFVGLEDTGSAMRSSDLSGFPAVSWTDHAVQSVNGAAATPAGSIYLATGFFTTQILRMNSVNAPAQVLCTASVAIHALGYGNGVLYGFANYATPMGIYSINTTTGLCTLVVDTSQQGYRYFGLDFNPVDGLLYGYTEYGSPDGLHSINPATGQITPVTGSFPADNTMGRALAVGNNTVYVCATQGSIGVGLQAWDLGTGGPWTSFTQPFPQFSANGGATWVPLPTPQCQVSPSSLDFGEVAPGSAVTRTFTITNTGGGTLSGTVSENCPEFSVQSGATYSLGAGQSHTVTLRFLSSGAGQFTCQVASGGSCAPVECTAEVALQPACGLSTTSLDFGEVPGEVVSAMPFTITNTGQGNLSGTVSLGACTDLGFSIQGASAYDLGPGLSQDFLVQFQNSLPGVHNCTIETGSSCPDILCSASTPVTGLLFAGLEDASVAPLTTDLGGFPNVTWNAHTAFDIAGAAATPEGTLYVCQGAFTTQIHQYNLSTGATSYLCTTSVALHGLGWVNGELYGFANFASPMGIYRVDLASGQCELALDLGASGFRFFALDGNAQDGLLYGYTEYGNPTGLYSIDVESGATTFLAASHPGSNSSARAMAVGNNMVFLTATRGDDGVDAYAWNLGTGGPWQPFTQPFPAYHSSGGAAWVATAQPSCGVEPASLDFGTLLVDGHDQLSFTLMNTGTVPLAGTVSSPCQEFTVQSGAFYSLAPGEFHTVTVRCAPRMAGTTACDLNLGNACGSLPCTAEAVAPTIRHGQFSPCGTVEELGHLPGATQGFIPDWLNGAVGLDLANGAEHALSASVMVDGAAMWTGPVEGESWSALSSGVNLPDWYGMDVDLWLELSDGATTWNANGSLCRWSLPFLDLDPASAAAAFRLLPAAPNPFNPFTTLRLASARAAFTTVELVDMQGRVVRILHQGILPAGETGLQVDGSALPSGLYLARARQEGSTRTVKLLLVK